MSFDNSMTRHLITTVPYNIMTIPAPWTSLWLRCLFVFTLCAVAATPLHAKTGPLALVNSSSRQGKATAPPPLFQDIPAEQQRITAHLEDAELQLTAARKALETPEKQQRSGNVQALKERINLLQERIQIARRHLDILAQVPVIRDEKRQLQEEFTTWIGFPEPPPYPYEMAEKIYRNLKTHEDAVKTDRTRLAAFDRGDSLAAEQLEQAKKLFRQTLEALEAALGAEEKMNARNQHEQSQLRLQTSEEGAEFVRASKQFLEEKVALNRLSEDLWRKKLLLALSNVLLTDEVFKARDEALGEQLEQAHIDLEASNALEIANRQKLVELFAESDRLRKDDESPAETLNLERQLREKQQEFTLATIDDINLRISYLQSKQDLWRQLFELYPHWELTRAKALHETFSTLLPVISEGLAAIDLARNEIDNFHVEEQFDVSAMAGPRQALVEALGLRSRQLALTKRSVLDLQDSVLLWQHMVKGRIGAMDLSEQAQGWKNLLKGYLQRLWAFELLSVEDTIVVDGASVLEKRPVTFGKMIQALLILFFGLLVASLMARLISRLVFPFSTIHEQRRHLIQKLLRVVMVVVVVILALVTVKIPLTVFAFLGGAIAIGIGFGAQNLLNNFISGFILLGENQIRVGDRIEIENNEGIVKSIGDRCTRVRRLDGVEILIPNSQLLERSVTNMTLSDSHIRKSIAIGVAYGSPTRKVQELLLEIVKSHHLVVVDPEPAVVFEDFGDNALLFNAYFWLDFASQKDFRAVISELRHNISERFAELGIVIAYPQRDVHLSVTEPLAIHCLKASQD